MVTECLPRPKQGHLRPKQGLSRPAKDLLVASQGLLKPNSGLLFTQVCKEHSSGQFMTSSGRQEGPQSSTEPSHCDGLLSWAERDPLRPKEGPLRAARDISGQQRDIFGGKGPCQTERWFFRPKEGPLEQTNSIPGHHKSLLGQQQSVQKESFSA